MRTRCFDLAEELADIAAAVVEAEINAALAERTPAEREAEAMREYEDQARLKGLPIGITIGTAKRRGWIEG